MKKSYLYLLAVSVIFGGLFISVPVSAAAPFSIKLDAPTIQIVDGKGQATVTGTFNSESGKYLDDVTYDTLEIRYGKYIDGAISNEKSGDILNDNPAKGLVTVGCYTSGTANPLGNKCKTTYNSDQSGGITATLSGLTNGSYGVFAFFLGDEDKQTLISGSGRNFTVETAKDDASISVSFNSVTVSGHDATVRIDVRHLPVAAKGYVQLGIATQVGSTSNYICVPGDWKSSEVIVGPTSGDNPVTGEFKLKDLPDNNYCVSVRASIPGVPSVTFNAGDPSSLDRNGYFTARGSLFSVGTATLAPGATNDGAANPMGCVTNSDNSNYCLLAPLPGLGDASGSLNVKKGIGDYFLIIIKITMGMIGVLSVLMIVIGGIEYMSTVSIGEKEGARARIVGALQGLLLALTSYIILNTLNPRLVNPTITIPGVEIEFIPGDDTDDNVGASLPTTTKPATGITVPSGTAQSLAQQILANSNISFTDPELGGDVASGPKQNVQATAAGKAAIRSKRGHLGATEVSLNSSMLAGLLALGNQMKVQVNEIAGARHSANSKHYSGSAFDIHITQSELTKAKSIMGICHAAGASLVIGPCNGNTSSKICAATGYNTNGAHQNHIHCQW